MVAKRAERILSQGHSVIVDAVFARESERAAIDDVASKTERPVRSACSCSADLATRHAPRRWPAQRRVRRHACDRRTSGDIRSRRDGLERRSMQRNARANAAAMPRPTSASIPNRLVNLIHGHSYRAQRADTVRRRASNPSPAARGADRREVFNQPPLSAQRTWAA